MRNDHWPLTIQNQPALPISIEHRLRQISLIGILQTKTFSVDSFYFRVKCCSANLSSAKKCAKETCGEKNIHAKKDRRVPCFQPVLLVAVLTKHSRAVVACR